MIQMCSRLYVRQRTECFFGAEKNAFRDVMRNAPEYRKDEEGRAFRRNGP